MADAPPAPSSRGATSPEDPGGKGSGGSDPARRERAGVASRRVNRFGIIAIAALVAGSLPLPWSLAGLAFGLLALVVGVMALVASLDARLKAGPITLLSVSLAIVAVLVLVQLLRVVIYPATVADQECRAQALTEAALAACDAELSSGAGLFSGS